MTRARGRIGLGHTVILVRVELGLALDILAENVTFDPDRNLAQLVGGVFVCWYGEDYNFIVNICSFGQGGRETNLDPVLQERAPWSRGQTSGSRPNRQCYKNTNQYPCWRKMKDKTTYFHAAYHPNAP